MFRKILFTGTVMVCGMVIITGCGDSGTTPVNTYGTVLLSEGFESGIASLRWEGKYMVSSEEQYTQMSITTAAAHTGTHSITADSNLTALIHQELDRVESGIVGVEFYMKAQTKSKANFGVEIGQNPGSSGAVSPAFGIFFDPSDSLKCTAFNSFPQLDSQRLVAPIQADHWYKCKVEVNMTTSIVSYYIDDALMHTAKCVDTAAGVGSGINLHGIDRLLVVRGQFGKGYVEASDGPKPYYLDDITYYKK